MFQGRKKIEINYESGINIFSLMLLHFFRVIYLIKYKNENQI